MAKCLPMPECIIAAVTSESAIFLQTFDKTSSYKVNGHVSFESEEESIIVTSGCS